MTSVDTRTRIAVVGGFAGLVGLALIPGLVLSAAGLPSVASVTTLSALAALIPALLASTRLALITAILMALAASVALPASTNPWLASAVLGVTGILIGTASRWGASGFVVLGGINIVFLVAEPPDLPHDPSSGALLAGATLASALWGVAAGHFIRGRVRSSGRPAPEGTSGSRTGAYAAVLGGVLAVAGWWTVDLQLKHGGAWFLMTFLIILQPYLQDSLTKTVHRALGTVAGVGLAMVVYALFGEWPTLLYILGALSAIGALTIRFTTQRPYWQYVILLTTAVVLLEGMSSSVITTAEQRIGFTLLAALIAIAVEAALAPLYRRSARRYGINRY